MKPDSDRIRVLVVDDHPMLRDGVVAVLGMHADIVVVGEAASGELAVRQAFELEPDVVLMDISMPGMGGLAAITAILERNAANCIVVLTTYGDEAQARLALKAGAVGYLLKYAVRSELIDTVRRVHAGERVISPEIEQSLALASDAGEVTQREIDVLRLVSRGFTNRKVAESLSLTEDAVRARLRTLSTKLSAKDRAHAVAIGIKRGFIHAVLSRRE